MKASNLAACALATAVAALPMAAGAVTAEVNGAAYHAVVPVAVTAQDTFAGAVLDLRGTDQTVASLTLGGRLQRKGKTTWGAIGSGAEHETPMITGGGILRVKGPSNGFMLIVR